MKFMKAVRLFESVTKIKNESVVSERRLLGLDVGNKHIGISVSNPPNQIAFPLSVLERRKTKMDLLVADLQTLIPRFSISGFVVGYPFNALKKCPKGVQVDLFMNELKLSRKFEDLMYTYWNECFTTKAVQFMLQPLQFHPMDYRRIKDKFAAVGILQGYLDFVNRERT